MKKRLLCLLLLSTMLVLTACGNSPAAGEKPLDTAAALKQVQIGTQGVEIDFFSNTPPSTVYDQNELVALIEVNNKGNHDLQPFDCFVQATGFDPNIIRGGFGQAKSCAEGYGVLEGKNVYNVEGATNQLEFRSPSVVLPPGVFEYNPTLNFMSCYNYHTIANPEVCVDPLFYEITSEQKTCRPTDVSMGGGQGSPVGVSYVGVDMIGNKAIFEINVKNYGSGRVLSDNTDIQSCGNTLLDYSDLDKVRYDVRLGGASAPLNCKPMDKIVRLNNGQGKIVCNAQIPGSSSFTSPLLIDLDYNYMQSKKKAIKIIKTPE